MSDQEAYAAGQLSALRTVGNVMLGTLAATVSLLIVLEVFGPDEKGGDRCEAKQAPEYSSDKRTALDTARAGGPSSRTAGSGNPSKASAGEGISPSAGPHAGASKPGAVFRSGAVHALEAPPANESHPRRGRGTSWLGM